MDTAIPVTILDPIGILKLPAWVAAVTAQLVKSPTVDHWASSGSWSWPIACCVLDPKATIICCEMDTNIPVLNGGAVFVSQLVASNTFNRLTFNGGTLVTGGTVFSNGADFVVGDGASIISELLLKKQRRRSLLRSVNNTKVYHLRRMRKDGK